jgi:hypothetical protein
MATYKVLYWQEVPSQVKPKTTRTKSTSYCPPRFMERVDRLAMQRGLQGSDDFLAQWHWSDEEERDGYGAGSRRGGRGGT